jgi:hypothetical protein
MGSHVGGNIEKIAEFAPGFGNLFEEYPHPTTRQHPDRILAIALLIERLAESCRVLFPLSRQLAETSRRRP